MNSLREELGGTPDTRPTPFTLLCPPGWRRVSATSLAEHAGAAALESTLREAARPDLLLQWRRLQASYRTAVRDAGVFRAYLAPQLDGIPLPAVLLVAPLVLPGTTPWDAALRRIARTADVVDAPFTETPMWMWRTPERFADAHSVMVGQSSHYVVPAPEAAARRALHFHFTVLVADDPGARELIEPLLATGDLIMSTMRWKAGA